MPAKPVPKDVLLQCWDTYLARNENATLAARDIGIPTQTLRSRLDMCRTMGLDTGSRSSMRPEFVPIPEELQGEELVEAAIARRTRRMDVAEAKSLRTVRVKETKPIGLIFFGDPHLDDDYCDLKLVRQHLAYTHEAGCFGICVGDFTNNWGGKLTRLYAEQGTTKDEATELIRWFLTEGNWLALGVSGNHEKMTQHDPVKIIAHEHGLVYADWQLRMDLQWPKWKNTASIKINIAHNHTGSSPVIAAYGGMKQAMFHERDDLYVCGHLHNGGYAKQVIDGKVVTSLRVAGYKTFDTHATMYGYRGNRIVPSSLVILCPDRPDEGRVTVFEDIELGLRVLKVLRA